MLRDRGSGAVRAPTSVRVDDAPGAPTRTVEATVRPSISLGGAEGSDGAAGGRLHFDRAIVSGGYQWLYLDGQSDDGSLAVVVIALLGNPFSPGYARAREASSRSRALDFCAMNVCLYRGRRGAFSLREGPISGADRAERSVVIGRSTMQWRDGSLHVDIEERTTPLGAPLRGRVVLHPEVDPVESVPLDHAGAHRWWPVCASGRIEVDFTSPGVRFAGRGYHDANAGSRPLESSFHGWNWSRAPLPRGRTVITYDVDETGRGEGKNYALDIGPGREPLEVRGLTPRRVSTTGWRLPRWTRVDPNGHVAVLRTLEDTPFYARSALTADLGGERSNVIHESLSVERLRRAWVRSLIGFRMGSRVG